MIYPYSARQFAIASSFFLLFGCASGGVVDIGDADSDDATIDVRTSEEPDAQLDATLDIRLLDVRQLDSAGDSATGTDALGTDSSDATPNAGDTLVARDVPVDVARDVNVVDVSSSLVDVPGDSSATDSEPPRADVPPDVAAIVDTGPVCIDFDEDGARDRACGGTDCDDNDFNTAPGRFEVCDGRDNNCNAMQDETFACVRNAPRACTTTCGSPGTETCQSGCLMYGACSGVEVCNACDDNGNGANDETFTCQRGVTSSCTTTCGSAGTRTCDSDCNGYSACRAATETCNGCDDNGVGGADDGFTCVQGATTSCTSICGTSGFQTCNGTCTAQTECASPLELCGNSCDDDNNGRADDGCPATTPPPNDTCATAATISASGSYPMNTCGSNDSVEAGCAVAGRPDVFIRLPAGTRNPAINMGPGWVIQPVNFPGCTPAFFSCSVERWSAFGELAMDYYFAIEQVGRRCDGTLVVTMNP